MKISKIKDEQIESVWAEMRERRIRRKLRKTERKWSKEYLLSPDLRKWLEWKEYEGMRREFNKSIFTWEEISAYKEKLRSCACQYDESQQCPNMNNNVEYFDICKKDCIFFPKTCPNCNEVLGEEVLCNLCGWTEQEQEEERSRTIPKSVQKEVWKRDLGKCIECGSTERLAFNHVIPFSKGGSNAARNIQLLCEKCNRSNGV
ncbi:hypothetical protein LCGC14_0960130 [marine sediment metagenome]|uniref:HNH nuclease domain-containing protein n=1 Tax=marine sediment metagenome TaxID=412755 RepID=A0A0F9NJG3_9ZZZZ